MAAGFRERAQHSALVSTGLVLLAVACRASRVMNAGESNQTHPSLRWLQQCSCLGLLAWMDGVKGGETAAFQLSRRSAASHVLFPFFFFFSFFFLAFGEERRWRSPHHTLDARPPRRLPLSAPVCV